VPAFTAKEGAEEPAAVRIRWAYGMAVSARKPDAAKRAFDEVLAARPLHARALYGRALLAAVAGRPAEAVTFFDRALEADPGFHQARRFRAVAHARCGRPERAQHDINYCLEREPKSGAVYYAAA